MSERLPARSTRGNRMNTLVAAEDKGEDEFWTQHKDMFADEAGDEEFAEEAEEEDIVDADFDAPEDQPAPEEEAKEAEAEAKDAEKPAKRKGNVYVDPKKKAPKRPRKEKQQQQQQQQREGGPERRKHITTVQTTDESVATHLRASTKKLTKQKHAERLRQEEEYEIRRASRPRRSGGSGGGEGPRFTQEQLLAEAARTEEANKASLEILLKIEEDRKRVAPVVPPMSGPMIRFKSSRQGGTTITFADHELPSPPFALALPLPPAPRVCAITGLPARYHDPKTNQGFASMAAFKALRERASAVKVQALSALLEEKRRKREEAARGSAASTPATPVATPGAQTAAAAAATPSTPLASNTAPSVATNTIASPSVPPSNAQVVAACLET